MCVLSIKVPIRKMRGNLFNDPRIFCVAIHVGGFKLGLKPG